MQPYRRTDRGRPAPRRVRGPGSAAPDRVRAWAFAPGCGPCRASTRATRRTAGKRTPPARARPSADGWARSGAWERRGLDAAGSRWAAPGAGRPRGWWRRPRDPPPGPRRPDLYPGHGADHATRGRPPGDAGNLAQATGQTGPGPTPHARVGTSREENPVGGTAGRAGRPGRGRRQAKTRPKARPWHAPDGGILRYRGRAHGTEARGRPDMGQRRITNITSTRINAS